MGYIGRGLDKIANVEKLDNITFDGGTTYALTNSSSAFTPNSANSLLVSIDGVIQQGNFSVSTTNIVFDWSPTSANTCNFIMHYGVGVLNTPADDTVTGAKIVDNAIDSEHYTDLSIDTAHIGATQVTGAKLNTDVISAQTALAVAPADTDEFMVSDAGVLKRIDYSLIKGGGKLLQVVQNALNPSAYTTVVDSWVAITDMSVAITPSATTSKVLVTFNCGGHTNDQQINAIFIRIKRDTTVVRELGRYGYDRNAAYSNIPVFLTYLDSPSTTSATTYTLEMKIENASPAGLHINRDAATNGGVSIAQEIGV